MTKESEQPSVRVGIVSWNVAHLLDACLASLPAALGSLPNEVVVVDNASADGSAEVAATHPDVRVIRNRANLGYARAVNQALAGTAAPVLVALNPDTELPPGSLATLVERLTAQPDVALVVPRLADRDGVLQHSVHRFPSVGLTLVACLFPPSWRSHPWARRWWLEGASPHDRSVDIDWAVGAVHVLRAEAVIAGGPYSQRWFMYVEDLDLCWRLSRQGWRRRLEADVEITHIGNASGAQAWGSQRTARWMAASYDWYRLAHGPRAARAWGMANTAGLAVLAGAYGARAWWGGDEAGRRRSACHHLAGLARLHLSCVLSYVGLPGRLGPGPALDQAP